MQIYRRNFVPQIIFNMASIKYELSKKDHGGVSEVKLRFSYKRGCVFRLRTGIFVPITSWNKEKGQLVIPRMHTKERVTMSLQQSTLDDLRNYLCTASINAKGGENSSYWQNAINVFLNGGPMAEEEEQPLRNETVQEAFDAFIDARATKSERAKQLRVVQRIILRYTLYIKRDLELCEWDDSHLCALEKFLKIEHTFFDESGECLKEWKYLYNAVPEMRPPKVRGGNAIFSIMKRLRTFFNWCVLTGRLSVSPFQKHRLQECTYGTPYYLTLEEMEALYNHDFSSQPSLAVQRDIFILQSNLGMRIGDFYSLTTANIVDDAIEYIPSKTLNESGRVARVPLTSRAKEIIVRYKNDCHLSLVPLISEQQYNKKIKGILRTAGINRVVTILNPTTRIEEQHPIWEVASSHMARRNFIGNLYAHVKDPDLISSMTGHVDGSKAFARYRSIDDTVKKEVLMVFEGMKTSENSTCY